VFTRSLQGTLLGLLLVSSPVLAEPALAPSLSYQPPETSRPLDHFGLMVDVGVPDGANISLVYRPLAWLRLHAGGGYNLVSPGVRAGVSLIPFQSGITPTLVFEAGHYFDDDANGIVQTVSGDPSLTSPLLRRVGYDYGNAHLGLEFGVRRATFFIHGGYSYLHASIHNATQASGGTVVFRSDPELSVIGLSARVGLILYMTD
jgi:hypothetical protein